MGKKAGMAKVKKGSKVQSDKVKTEAEQEKTTALEAPKKVQAVPGKSKEPATKIVKKESGKPKGQYYKDTIKFFQSVWSELKKVHWPTRSELVVYTAVVLCSVVVVALLIWIVDSILSQLLNYIL